MTEENQYLFEASLEDGEIEDLELEEDKLQIELEEDKLQTNPENSPNHQLLQQASPTTSTISSRKVGLDDFDIEPKRSEDESSYEKIEDFQKRRRMRLERKKKKIVSFF